MLTPFVDKLLMVGISIVTGKVDTESGAEHVLTPSENTRAVLKIYKLMIMFTIYGYSGFIRKYREDRKDFTDKEEFAKIIENMIGGLKWHA